MQYRPTRYKTRAPARLILDGEGLAATIRDISRDGARVDLPRPAPPGSAVYLEFGRARVPAMVHWCKDGAAGLRFLDRLDARTLAMIEKAGAE